MFFITNLGYLWNINYLKVKLKSSIKFVVKLEFSSFYIYYSSYLLYFTNVKNEKNRNINKQYTNKT